MQCHINDVTLIDVRKDTVEELRDPKLAERFSPEQLGAARKHSFDALEQCCPETRQGSAHFLLMHLKPDQETGTHGFPLKGCVIQTPMSPDASKIPAELFLYYERINAWTETVL